MHTTMTPTDSAPVDEDAQYTQFLAAVRERFAKLVGNGKPLFSVQTKDLFEAFLSGLPASRRQHYRCNECAHFFHRFGNVVTLGERGATNTFWPDPDEQPALVDQSIPVPPFFSKAIQNVRKNLSSGRVQAMFLWPEKTWGTPSNKAPQEPFVWHHLHVVPPAACVLKTESDHAQLAMSEAAAARALKSEDFKMLNRACKEYSLGTAITAVSVLSAGDDVFRAERVLGVAQWFRKLMQDRLDAKTNDQANNIVWLAVATAPEGFCHVRNTMIGTLLDDIQAGVALPTAIARFNEKMHPLKYQRPVAAPSEGNINQAEKLMAKLHSARSLERRFATLDDIRQHALWMPKESAYTPLTKKNIFDHLRERAQTTIQDYPTIQTCTWRRFRETVLPSADKLELFVTSLPMSFFGFVTAVDPTSPPVLLWDTDNARNPVSWYFYNNGSTPDVWGLRAQEYVPVEMITLQPNRWNGGFEHLGDGAFFVLRGARDQNPNPVRGLFVESLKSEYHPIRRTLEAFMGTARIVGTPAACGVAFTKGMTAENKDRRRVRVTSGAVRTVYLIDRWD